MFTDTARSRRTQRPVAGARPNATTGAAFAYPNPTYPTPGPVMSS